MGMAMRTSMRTAMRTTMGELDSPSDICLLWTRVGALWTAIVLSTGMICYGSDRGWFLSSGVSTMALFRDSRVYSV